MSWVTGVGRKPLVFCIRETTGVPIMNLETQVGTPVGTATTKSMITEKTICFNSPCSNILVKIYDTALILFIQSYRLYELYIMRPCTSNTLVAHRPQARTLILTCPICTVKWYHIPVRGMLTRTKSSLLKKPTSKVLFVISMFTAQLLVNAVWTWILQIKEYDKYI